MRLACERGYLVYLYVWNDPELYEGWMERDDPLYEKMTLNCIPRRWYRSMLRGMYGERAFRTPAPLAVSSRQHSAREAAQRRQLADCSCGRHGKTEYKHLPSYSTVNLPEL